MAARAITEYEHAAREPLEITLGDDQAFARENAAWALGAIGSRESVIALGAASSDDNPDVREEIAWALGAIGSGSGVDALSNLIIDAEPEVREQAAWALGRLGNNEATAALRQRNTVEDDESVRDEIRLALQQRA